MKLIGSTIIAAVAAQASDQPLVNEIINGLGDDSGLGFGLAGFARSGFGVERAGAADLFAGGEAAASSFQEQLDIKLPGLRLEEFIVNGAFDTAAFQAAARDKLIEMQAAEAAQQIFANIGNVATNVGGRPNVATNIAGRPSGGGRPNEVAVEEKYFSRTTTTSPTTPPLTTTDYDLPECWHCDASSFSVCALEGYYKSCQWGDYDCCFIEVREQRDQLKQLCTGCKSYQACHDLKSQNFVFSNSFNPVITHEMPHDQCRPQHGKLQSKGRFRNNPSVCRQCFNLCDKDEAEGSYCFGGIYHNGVDFEGRDWLTNSDSTFGIPTWRIFDDVADSTDLATFTTNAAGNDFETWYFADAATGKTHPTGGTDNFREAAEMAYWRIQDQDKTWWESDLKHFQNMNKGTYPSGTV